MTNEEMTERIDRLNQILERHSFTKMVEETLRERVEDINEGIELNNQLAREYTQMVQPYGKACKQCGYWPCVCGGTGITDECRGIPDDGGHAFRTYTDGWAYVTDAVHHLLLTGPETVCCPSCGGSGMIPKPPPDAPWPVQLNTMPPDEPEIECDEFGPILSKTRRLNLGPEPQLGSSHEVENEEAD